MLGHCVDVGEKRSCSRWRRCHFLLSIPPPGVAEEFIAATMSAPELACSYAALILHDDSIPVTAEKISTLVKAANVKVDSYWPSLFSKLLEKRSVEDLIMNVGSGGGAAPIAVAAPSGGGAATAPAAVEEKKEEPKEESDDDMGFSLFD